MVKFAIYNVVLQKFYGGTIKEGTRWLSERNAYDYGYSVLENAKSVINSEKLNFCIPIPIFDKPKETEN